MESTHPSGSTPPLLHHRRFAPLVVVASVRSALDNRRCRSDCHRHVALFRAPLVMDTEEELSLLQIDVGDILKVKQILDETVAGTISESNPDLSIHGDKVILREDYRHDNRKLMLMCIACVFAAVAQFGLKTEFPDDANRWALGLCCAVYFCISGLLQLILTFVDKDCILVTQPLVEEGMIRLVRQTGNKEMDRYGIRVRTQFPRFSEFYTVRLEFEGKESSEFVMETWSVGKFFDVDGYFDEEGLSIEIEELYQRFERGDFEKGETTKEGGIKKD